MGTTPLNQHSGCTPSDPIWTTTIWHLMYIQLLQLWGKTTITKTTTRPKSGTSFEISWFLLRMFFFLTFADFSSAILGFKSVSIFPPVCFASEPGDFLALRQNKEIPLAKNENATLTTRFFSLSQTGKTIKFLHWLCRPLSRTSEDILVVLHSFEFGSVWNQTRKVNKNDFNSMVGFFFSTWSHVVKMPRQNLFLWWKTNNNGAKVGQKWNSCELSHLVFVLEQRNWFPPLDVICFAVGSVPSSHILCYTAKWRLKFEWANQNSTHATRGYFDANGKNMVFHLNPFKCNPCTFLALSQNMASIASTLCTM